MSWRLGRFLAVVVVSYAVAAFLIWLGLRLVIQPSTSIPSWLGWVVLGTGMVKAMLWTVYSAVFVRHRKQLASSLRR